VDYLKQWRRTMGVPRLMGIARRVYYKASWRVPRAVLRQRMRKRGNPGGLRYRRLACRRSAGFIVGKHVLRRVYREEGLSPALSTTASLPR
jgi:hypothetical protein